MKSRLVVPIFQISSLFLIMCLFTSCNLINPVKVEKSVFGQMPDGTGIELYALTNALGMEAQIMTYGATLISVKTPDYDGNLENVTLRLDTFDDYLKGHPLFGSIVGRFANRIEGATFALDGVEYALTKNTGKNHIHGGREGFQKVVWKAEPYSEDEWGGVDFLHTSPDGHEGYPGNLNVRIRYVLSKTTHALEIRYMATTDKPTILNLTNHVYWNLGGPGSGDVLDHTLTLYSDKYLPSDESKIPSGEILPVRGTVMDFTHPQKIGSRIKDVPGENYDHCYVVDREPKGSLTKIAYVNDVKGERWMEVYTTQPGFQFYTASHLGNRYTYQDKPYGPYHGFCLETQNFPDAPNKSHFPSCVLRPGETYEHVTRFEFGGTRLKETLIKKYWD